MRNKILFRIEREDGEIELFIKTKISAFSGEGQAFFSKKTLEEFIEGVSQYPIDGIKPPVLSGGYWDQEGNAVVQENVHVSFMPKGNRGQIDLTIRLALPSNEDQMKSLCSCSFTIGTTYEELSNFVEKFRSLINDELPEDSFEYPLHVN